MKRKQVNQAVVETVRRWARPTTPDELKKKGVAHLRSINLQSMAFLIEKAVNRALLERTIGGPDEHQDSISDATRDEFLRLLQNAPTEPGELEARAKSELRRLKRQLVERRKNDHEHESAVRAGDSGPVRGEDELTHKVRTLFLDYTSATGRSAPRLEREVTALVCRELHEQRMEVERERLEQHQLDTERLERRIGKLSTILGQTERELAEMTQRKLIDPGEASIYKTVQGLDMAAGGSKRKAELLSAIFEANLLFQRKRA
ncbi:MAG: hypothetical protein E2O39_14995 [Planctomycetota bacterium]|nr:MAG: hypothetical protein E2O39_14995 [Planctomycetota bacterium]